MSMARELDDDDQDLDTLTRDDLQDLYGITARIQARGEALDVLAALRKKLKRAVKLKLVGLLEPAAEADDVPAPAPPVLAIEPAPLREPPPPEKLVEVLDVSSADVDAAPWLEPVPPAIGE